MGLYRTFSEINGDFSRKSQVFPTPVYFAPTLKGFPLELGIGARGQKLEWWGYRAEKKFNDIFSSLEILLFPFVFLYFLFLSF